MKTRSEHEEKAWAKFRKQTSHIWTTKDLGYVFVLGLIFGMLMLAPNALADNIISIEQTGDNLDLDIHQFGADNEIKMLDQYSFINSSSLDLLIIQYNTEGNDNTIVFDEINGTGNEFKLGQGISWDGSDATVTGGTGWSYDGYEGGGHYMEIDLYGNNNYVEWHQTNQSNSNDGHDFNLHVAGSNNFIDGRQQSSGAKEVELTLYNSDNNVELRQKGNNAQHTADIVLDGIYGTDLILKQLGSTTQSYSLSIDCLTVGGCSVNVTQD